MSRRFLLATAALALAVAPARAELKTKAVTYEHDGVTFKGHLAWDDAKQGKRPGVLVVHEWWGLNDYARQRAEQLAGLGYVAFACDMYGNGKTTEHPKEAGTFAGEVRKNVKAWQGRAEAALKVLQQQDAVDPKRCAAIGYCFGGSTALQLAYTGADLKAVVTFHAALPVPTEEQAKAIKARIQVHHGADDSFIPAETIEKFKAALDEAKVKYEFVSHPEAVHSFTVKGADAKNLKGIAYNEAADKKSWKMMLELFGEVFGEKK
ncbi:MAG TPA: dienelactone hydrolase family protein [Gemmataceae bacterium]|nr:dienelactone hydrolase family protein [Gemmataceae bacterium]